MQRRSGLRGEGSIEVDGVAYSAAAIRDMAGKLEALGRSQAVIEFTPDGEILTANKNFLAALGYSLDEIRGRHHRMFVDSVEAQRPAYADFWERLARGEFQAGLFRRIAKGGREVWIQASYDAVRDGDGRVVKVVKHAADVTEAQLRAAEQKAKIDAIDRSQAVIEFSLDGTILAVNDHFRSALGYRADEIVGQHHSMFLEPRDRDSDGYRRFWEKLRVGQYDSGRYRRLGKGGREVWIQATYNPVLDAAGRPVKVVKFAQDITAEVRLTQATERAVEDVMRIVRAAGADDLTPRIPLDEKSDALATLCGGVNELMDVLSDIVGQMRGAAGAIEATTRAISSGNQSFARRTEAQAASLEETAASMEELTSTVKQNAENARQANQLAAGASDVAVRGGEVVRQVVSTMGDISESSEKIADIIAVIDGIAFQTNILALNAAVEAARAGEEGRGFAVVATEVRNLAQRSAAAAKEIKTLIVDSVEKVGSGTRLVDQAGRTMDEIVVSVKRVTDIMAEITAASAEQSSGIEQMNQAITLMDEATQQNAALVEEAGAAAESLEEQARTLSDAVSRFKVTEADAGAWDGVERRGPDRAKNVTRLPKPAAQKVPSKPLPAKRSRVAAGAAAEGWDEF